MNDLLEYARLRLAGPQYSEFARVLNGQHEFLSAGDIAYWQAKAAEWSEWLAEDAGLLPALREANGS